MCRGCWEGQGSPTASGNPEVAALAAMVRDEIVSPYGALHVVVDDWNLEDRNFPYCLELDYCTDEDRDWAKRMLALDLDTRFAVMGLADGFWSNG